MSEPEAERVDGDALEIGGVLVAGGLDLQPRRLGADELGDDLHVFGSALVHGDEGIFEPSLGFEVADESGKKRAPELVEEVGAGLRFAALDLALVVLPTDYVSPGAHRVAVDARTESACFREGDVLVEELEIMGP